MSENSFVVWKYFYSFHGDGERVQIGQEKVSVVHKDLVVEVLGVVEAEEEGARQEIVVHDDLLLGSEAPSSKG